LVGFVATYFGQVEFSLQSVIEFLTVGVSAIGIGVAGAVLLLIITAPAVGYELPPAILGWIEGDHPYLGIFIKL